MSCSGPQFGVVILGAGASSRMGKPKLLLPWRETTVIGHIIGQWQPLASQIAVVCRPDDQALGQALTATVARIPNPAPELGMFSSVQCAARWPGWRAEITHFVVALGDQPHLPASLLREVLAFATAHPDRVCQPARNGRPRHPVVIPRSIFNTLATTNSSNLKEFLRGQKTPVALLEYSGAVLDLDLDTQEDFAILKECDQLALERFQALDALEEGNEQTASK